MARSKSILTEAKQIDRAMLLARYNPEVIRLDRKQAEFSRPVWLAPLVKISFLASALPAGASGKMRAIAALFVGSISWRSKVTSP